MNEANEPNEQDPAPAEIPEAALPPAGGAAEEPPRAEDAGPRRLYRSRDDDWLGGVAGGLAEYFGTDPTLIRILFIIAAFVSAGFAVIAYVIAWIIVPENPGGAERSSAPRSEASGVLGPLLWGGILIIGGTIFLLAQLDLDIDLPRWEVGFAAALILVGVLMLIEARRGFHGGLITLAVLLTGLLAISTVTSFNIPTDGAFGDATHVITDAADLDDEYSHAFGQMTVDLRNLEVPAGTTEVEISMVFGNVDLRLPADIPYRISADSVFGSIEGTGIEWRGVAAGRDFTSPGYAEASSRLNIDLSVVFGSGRVER